MGPMPNLLVLPPPSSPSFLLASFFSAVVLGAALVLAPFALRRALRSQDREVGARGEGRSWPARAEGVVVKPVEGVGDGGAGGRRLKGVVGLLLAALFFHLAKVVLQAFLAQSSLSSSTASLATSPSSSRNLTFLFLLFSHITVGISLVGLALVALKTIKAVLGVGVGVLLALGATTVAVFELVLVHASPTPSFRPFLGLVVRLVGLSGSLVDLLLLLSLAFTLSSHLHPPSLPPPLSSARLPRPPSPYPPPPRPLQPFSHRHPRLVLLLGVAALFVALTMAGMGWLLLLPAESAAGGERSEEGKRTWLWWFFLPVGDVAPLSLLALLLLLPLPTLFPPSPSPRAPTLPLTHPTSGGGPAFSAPPKGFTLLSFRNVTGGGPSSTPPPVVPSPFLPLASVSSTSGTSGSLAEEEVEVDGLTAPRLPPLLHLSSSREGQQQRQPSPEEEQQQQPQPALVSRWSSDAVPEGKKRRGGGKGEKQRKLSRRSKKREKGETGRAGLRGMFGGTRAGRSEKESVGAGREEETPPQGGRERAFPVAVPLDFGPAIGVALSTPPPPPPPHPFHSAPQPPLPPPLVHPHPQPYAAPFLTPALLPSPAPHAPHAPQGAPLPFAMTTSSSPGLSGFFAPMSQRLRLASLGAAPAASAVATGRGSGSESESGSRSAGAKAAAGIARGEQHPLRRETSAASSSSAYSTSTATTLVAASGSSRGSLASGSGRGSVERRSRSGSFSGHGASGAGAGGEGRIVFPPAAEVASAPGTPGTGLPYL